MQSYFSSGQLDKLTNDHQSGKEQLSRENNRVFHSQLLSFPKIIVKILYQ